MTIHNRPHVVSANKSWAIVGVLIGMLIVAGLSAVIDLAAGIPIGSTIITNLEHTEPVAIVVSGVFLVVWFWMIYAPRHDNHQN